MSIEVDAVPSESSPLENLSHRSNREYHYEAVTTHLPMNEIDPNEQMKRPSVIRHKSFIVHFATSKGAPQIVTLCLLLALGFGSTIGVVPAVVTDRYARLNHEYIGERDCADFGIGEIKPQACLDGSNDAQGSAATANLISNGLTFLTSSMMGSISDEYGRRNILVVGLFFSVLHPLALVLLQVYPTMSPDWYYATNAISGIVNWIAVALSALSDVMPPKWRAASFGLLLAGFSLGFALSPILALILDHFHVSLFSLAVVLSGFIMTVCFLPETLPVDVAWEAKEKRLAERQALGELTQFQVYARHATRPMRELSILNRNKLFRLLSSLAFFSGMVTSGDRTLLLYYAQERFSFNDKDIALMFFLVGVLGILVQGLLIKPINDCIGERFVIVVAFLLGTLHNVIYGLATCKIHIFIAIIISSFTGMAFPTISAIKSNNVNESEQGRIQGALYSLQALASALGPVLLRAVYKRTRDNAYPGPGTMFIFAAALELVAVACAYGLPKDQANSSEKKENDSDGMDDLKLDGGTEHTYSEHSSSIL